MKEKIIDIIEKVCIIIELQIVAILMAFIGFMSMGIIGFIAVGIIAESCIAYMCLTNNFDL